MANSQMRSQITKINKPTKKRKPPKELVALLNLLPEAAIFVDCRQSQILAANEKAAEFSSYKINKLEGLELKRILPKLDEAFLEDGLDLPQRTILTVLIKQSGIQADVELFISQHEINREWILIRFIPEGIGNQETNNELLDQRWQALQILSDAPKIPDLNLATKQIMQAGLLLTSASFIAIYLPSNEGSPLSITYEWGKSGFLPKDLNSTEINHLRLPYIWISGDKAISELHTMAIAGNLSYVATIPINKNSPQEGIIIIGDQISNPPNGLAPLLNILANTFSTCLKHHSETVSMNNDLKNITNQMNISMLIKDVINDGLIYINKDQEIFDINLPAAITLGYTIDEVKGKTLGEILVGEKSISESINSLPQDNMEMKNLGDFNIHRRDGNPILLNIKAMPVMIDNNTSIIALLLSDLSQHEEYKLRTKQLEQQALLGEVMAIFAHEVRNPINNISTGLQVLASNFPEGHSLRGEIGRLKQDLDRLAELMKSVLTFSKSKEYKIESVNVEFLIKNLIDRWRPRMTRDKILPRIQCPPKIPPVKGDRRALEQVFTNVIQNSINAMRDQGGVLGIKIEPTSTPQAINMLDINISDTGPGIPEEIKDRIFEPFFTTNKNGTGLGLAITKRIVAAHNGQIRVNSFPGGTVFTITLPTE
jgi:two-component system sensor histidine kinase AtoS